MICLTVFSFSGMITHASASTRNALILSSVDRTEPFGFHGAFIVGKLQSIGYTVTTLKDSQVTVDLLRSGLNNYDIVIWRTYTYVWAHTTYWYVGELASQALLTKYAGDIRLKDLDIHAGIVGVSTAFFQTHFSSLSLRNVKLVVLLSSMSNTIAGLLVKAGAHAAVYCISEISLQFGLVDDLAAQVVAYLVMGQTLSDAIWTTITPYLTANPPEDNLDSIPTPPFWYNGDGTLTIK